MTATPEELQPVSPSESSSANFFKKTLLPAVLDRDTLNYATFTGYCAYLNYIGTSRTFDLAYQVIDHLTGNMDLTQLDNSRNAVAAVSIWGGYLIGDFIYTTLKKTRIS